MVLGLLFVKHILENKSICVYSVIILLTIALSVSFFVIGNKNKAIELAASKANATNYTAVNYPKSHKSLTETLSENKIFNLEF